MFNNTYAKGVPGGTATHPSVANIAAPNRRVGAPFAGTYVRLSLRNPSWGGGGQAGGGQAGGGQAGGGQAGGGQAGGGQAGGGQAGGGQAGGGQAGGGQAGGGQAGGGQAGGGQAGGGQAGGGQAGGTTPTPTPRPGTPTPAVQPGGGVVAIATPRVVPRYVNVDGLMGFKGRYTEIRREMRLPWNFQN